MDCWLTGQQQQQQPRWMAGSPTLAISILQGQYIFLSSICNHVTLWFQFPAAVQDNPLSGRGQVNRSQPICTLSQVLYSLSRPISSMSPSTCICSKPVPTTEYCTKPLSFRRQSKRFNKYWTLVQLVLCHFPSPGSF